MLLTMKACDVEGGSFRTIQAMTGVPKSTVSNIVKHALTNARAAKEVQGANDAETASVDPDELLLRVDVELELAQRGLRVPKLDNVSLLDLIAAENLDAAKRSGRPLALSEADKDKLAAFVRTGFESRRMALTDIKRETGFGHLSNQTISRGLQDRGIKQYREEFKFILKEENKFERLTYCLERREWTMEEWGNCGFTDEMSIEVSIVNGINIMGLRLQIVIYRWE